MNILFFTPGLVASAIGRVSRLVVDELLRQGHTVVVVRSEDIDFLASPTHSFHCRMLNWMDTDQVRRVAGRFDLSVYQFGNHYAYHRGCLEWLPTVPGLVCLHDNFLGHLFWAWSETVGRPQALAVLTKLYNADSAHRFFDHSDSASFLAYASQEAPVTEWVASMASAVIVHSSWAMDRITASCPGPVEVVPLPYDAPYGNAAGIKTHSPSDDRLVALTVGHVNPNKRYLSVIHAIGTDPLLRERLVYRIVGAVEPAMEMELRSSAGKLGVQVVIAGEVDDRQLATEICNADIMVCLRWPALEAASASTIESMLYGKPTIVTDTGFYRDLPSDCVFKISPESELDELRALLQELIQSPDIRDLWGSTAQAYATKTFRAENYASRVIQMQRKIGQAKILSAAAQILSGTLLGWGARKNEAIVGAVAAPLAILR